MPPSAAAQRRRSKWRGLLAAVGVAGLFAFSIWFFTIRGNAPQTTATGPGLTPPSLIDEQIQNITDLEGSAGGMYIELMAKDDPDTLVGIIEAESFEPVGLNEKLVERPRAWLFFEDGRTGYVEADRGRFFMSSSQDAPEAGQLDGHVRLRLFDAQPGGDRPDLDATEPLVTTTFDEPLDFDFRHSRVSSTGHFVVTTPEIEWAGTYLTGVLNQVRQRLEVIEVRNGEYIKYTPKEKPADRARQPVAASQPAPPTLLATAPGSTESTEAVATTNPTASPAPVEPKIDRYKIIFLDNIAVSHRSQQLKADQLELWLRLVDNALPEGAIAEFKGGEQQPALEKPIPAPSVVVSSLSEPIPAAQPAADGMVPLGAVATTLPLPFVAEQSPADPLAPVIMRWTGAMRVVPIDDADPPELASNDLTLRLTAERSGHVAFADTESGASGHTVGLDYGFTQGELLFRGPGSQVELSMDGSGTLTASRLAVGLSTGLVHIQGPGVLKVDELDTNAATAQATSISWSEQADFIFDTPGGRITSDLTRATLAGMVEAADGQSRLTGSNIDARFVAGRTGQRRLDSITVTDGHASDGLGAFLQADTIGVALADGTRANEMDPKQLTASGSVRTGQGDSQLTAETLTVALGRDMDGKVQPTTVDASGGGAAPFASVRYTNTDGTATSSPALRADVVGKVITLAGSPDAHSTIEHRGGTISGASIHIDDRNRTARIDGPGSFVQHAAPGAPRNRGEVLATWTEGMSFDDHAGRVECWGQANVVSHPQPGQKDTIASERLLIELSPARRSDSFAGTDQPRSLLRASAYGVIGSDGSAQPATVESRVYAANAPDTVERLFYLEGMQITADQVNQRLAVPQAGKLIILDRRQPAAGAPAPSDDQTLMGELAGGGPALTRFEWHDGMLMERHTGTVVMRSSVRVRHKSLVGGQLTDLQCDQLMAQIQETTAPQTSAGKSSDAVRGELIRAEALGKVYFTSAGREVTSDRLLYDAQNGRALATALPGKQVTLFDSARAAPVSAASLTWDLIGDRISIDRPAPIVAPNP